MPMVIDNICLPSRRPVRAGLVAAMAVTALLAGCSGTSGTNAASSTAASVSSAVPAPVVTTVPAEQALDPLLVATVPLDNPDGLVTVGDSLFVKTDDGRVVRIDPKAGKVTGEVKLDTATDKNNYCQGITTDGTTIWACSASDAATGVVRVTPRP